MTNISNNNIFNEPDCKGSETLSPHCCSTDPRILGSRTFEQTVYIHTDTAFARLEQESLKRAENIHLLLKKQNSEFLSD